MIIAKYLAFKNHLGKNAQIVHCPDFETGIVKVQSGEKLTKNEQNAIATFKTSSEPISPEKVDESFSDKIIRMAEADIQNKAVYRSVAHVCPTSVVVERLFSQTKHIMTDNRKLMDPSTLEMCIMLKTNKDLWNAKTVDDVIELCRREKKAKAAAHKFQQAWV